MITFSLSPIKNPCLHRPLYPSTPNQIRNVLIFLFTNIRTFLSPNIPTILQSTVVLSKVVEAVSSCACAACCDCWDRGKEKAPAERIHIHHTCLEQQPQASPDHLHGRLDSTSSNADSIRSYRLVFDLDLASIKAQ